MSQSEPWKAWGTRFRALLKEKESTLAKLAEKMELAESTLRSWTNGTREINLADFFALCVAADVDPAIALFGRPLMSEEQRKQLGDLAAAILEADPAAKPEYATFGNKVRKTVSARKAAEAKAASRLKAT